jgi:ribosomal protein S18 acetylase RimI-like enzyme
MTLRDLDAVMSIAAVVHPDLPERIEVFAEKLTLFPGGCMVLDAGGELAGYAVSHPWRALSIPPLDAFLSRLPDRPGTHYLHDLALLPAARGQGAGRKLVELLVAYARAADAASLSLVSVYGTVPFWRKQGFAIASTPELVAALLAYGTDARFMMLPLPNSDR